jgi:hypothetical protein
MGFRPGVLAPKACNGYCGATLPARASGALISLRFLVDRVLLAGWTELLEGELADPLGPSRRAVVPRFTLRARERDADPWPTAMRQPGAGRHGSDRGCHARILVTMPAPTVRPPSRMAKRCCSSSATGVMSSMVILVLSPGMTILVPSGSATVPVTSVVRM